MDDKFKHKANNLKLINLGSSSVQYSGLDNDKLEPLLKELFVDNSYVVAWLDYKVLIGTCSKGSLRFCDGETFDYKHIQRLRVFNRQKELLLWRNNGKWNARARNDDLAGKGATAVVAEQVVVGTDARPINGMFTEISEKRGAKLNIPFTNIKVDDKQRLLERVFIKTHNYVKTNTVHQASYFDCRFVEFTAGENTLSQENY